MIPTKNYTFYLYFHLLSSGVPFSPYRTRKKESCNGPSVGSHCLLKLNYKVNFNYIFTSLWVRNLLYFFYCFIIVYSLVYISILWKVLDIFSDFMFNLLVVTGVIFEDCTGMEIKSKIFFIL